MALPSLPNSQFRAQVGDTSFDLAIQDGQLLHDGTPVDIDFEPMDDGYVTLRLNGQSVPAVAEPQGDGRYIITIGHRRIPVQVQDAKALLLERYGLAGGAHEAIREIRAPMPGLVLRVVVEAGQEVQEGDGLLVLEAMKMENELRAPAEGTVETVHVEAGKAVGKNELLITFAA